MKVSDAKSFCKDVWNRFWDSASDEMKAAIMAGIPLDWKVTSGPGGTHLTATTKWPCALVEEGGKQVLYYKVEERNDDKTHRAGPGPQRSGRQG